MPNILQKLCGTAHERVIKRLRPRVARINDLEPAWMKLSDAQLRAKPAELRTRLDNGAKIDDLLEEAFATVREASRRVVHMRHDDVQLA